MYLSDYHLKNDTFKSGIILFGVVRLFHSSEDTW
jgi:hypothetical protein